MEEEPIIERVGFYWTCDECLWTGDHAILKSVYDKDENYIYYGAFCPLCGAEFDKPRIIS